MLVNPFSGPSTTYIKVPRTVSMISTNPINTMILRLLATRAVPSDPNSET